VEAKLTVDTQTRSSSIQFS